MKTCTRCNEEKDESKFQARRASKDGLTASCKKCLSEYEKRRANLPHRVKARNDYSQTAAGKIAGAKAKKKWSEKNIIKRAAHILVGNAVRDGRLIKKTCEECGENKVHAHHDDYAKPFAVTWLCSACHNKWHKENGEGKNAT